MRRKGYIIKKIITVFITAILLIALLFLSTGCVCPLFSALERFTGLKISTGENIDMSTIEDELIYPDSIALVQLTGNIDRILELIGEYGVALSEDEMEVLEHLPETITEQEVGATAYSTADNKVDVVSYYNSLTNKGWDINDFSDAGGSLEGNSMFIAKKGDREQVFMVAGTENNSFIIFIDFDWDVLEGEDLQ